MSAPFDLLRTRLGKGTLLLEASAGTGKTYTITGIVLRMLLEGIVDDLSQVLVVTFTIAATEELKTRLRAAIADGIAACAGGTTDAPFLRHLASQHGPAGAEILRRALAQADEMSVATIHGFCRRVLEEAAFESGQPFVCDFVDDEIPLLAEAARDAVRLEVLTRDPVTAALARHCGLLPDDLLRDYREFRRHADTVLRPDPGELEPALTAVRSHLAAARTLAVASDLPTAVLNGFDYRKYQRPGQLDMVTDVGGLLRSRLVDTDDPALDLLLEFDPDLLLTRLKVKGRPAFDHPLFGICRQLTRAVTTAGHALRAALFTRIDERRELQAQQSHALTFQDLLTRVAAVLREPKLGKALLATIRGRWRAALIDEFQDTDPLQYGVFQRCFGDQRLLLVGDPKQSIYGFRGADVHSYLQARDDARATHTLGENHRSHPLLVAAVDQLFAGQAAFAMAGIRLPPVRAALTAADCAIHGEDLAPLQLRWLGPGMPNGKLKEHNRDYGESRVIVDLADECVRLLGSPVALATGAAPGRCLVAGDIAVLTRTNAQATAVQDELRRRGVHSAIGKAGDVFQCPEMDDLQRLLQALTNPGYLPLLRAAWTTPLFGFERAALQALDLDQSQLARQLELADGWRRTWVRHGFIVMFQDLLDRQDTRARLLARSDGERKLTNYLQIAELLHRAEMARQLAPESLVQWLDHERRHAQEIDYELRELRLESDADAVQILTVHGSKGLQYEVVFVPFAWNGRDATPSGRPLLARTDAGHHEFCFDGPERARHLDGIAREALAEDLRLLYVAITRARRRCYLHWVAGNQTFRSALGYLLVGPGRIDADASLQATTAVWHQETKDKMAQWRSAAADLAAASGGAIGLADLAIDPPPEPRPTLPTAIGARLARPRPLPDRVPPGFRIGSFTSMLSHERTPEPLREQDEPDRAIDSAPLAPTPPAGMFAFARGAQPGICLHEILEHADFAAIAAPATLELVRQTLWRHGLAEPTAHRAPIDPAATVAAMLAALAAAPLAELPFRLDQVLPAARSNEWQFFVRAGRIVPRDLAAVFATAAALPLQAYARHLQALPTGALQGFLRGFVDLVVEHAGRYYVFDWKSNWLGDAGADYRRPQLLADMQQNHYVLQYHLYLLALHRHLRSRLPDYDYDRHVGGACYVYLRGIGQDDAGAGVFCDRPGFALIEALDRWLAGDPRPGARR